jgi:hypothetical protein
MGHQSKEFNFDEFNSEWLHEWFAVAVSYWGPSQFLLEEDR